MPSTVGKKLFDRILYQHLNHDKEAPLVQFLYWVVYDAGQVKTSKYVIVCVMLLSYNLVRRRVVILRKCVPCLRYL